jgi:hypothetical protein
MATLKVSLEQVPSVLDDCIRTGEDLEKKVRIAEKAHGHADWINLFDL